MVVVGSAQAQDAEIVRAEQLFEDLFGDGFPQDEVQLQEAKELWEQLAADGFSNAKYFLSFMYSMGLGGAPQNESKALSLLMAAAESGDARAQASLANKYEHGTGVQLDYATAIEWWQKAAEQGNSLARSRLSRAYMFGEIGLSVDFDLVNHFSEPYSQMSAVAQRCLESVSKNPGQIEIDEDCHRVAERQDAASQYALGAYFGTSGELEKAASWFAAAAGSGSVQAYYALGQVYRDLDMLEQAIDSYTRYWNAGAEGRGNTARLLYRLELERGNETQANLWLQRCQESELAECTR